MGKSSNKRGPDFRVLRPDLEASRTACDKPIMQWDLDNDVSIEFCPSDDEQAESSSGAVWIDPELAASEKS